jgi:outer membrane cobalamin receptor
MELPGYHLWSARLAWKPKSGKKYGFQTFCEARNLLDKTFQSVPGYPMPGRQWALGLEFRML